MKYLFLLKATLIILSVSQVKAQLRPVIVEAESGTAGSDWDKKVENGITYVTSKTDMIDPNVPGSKERLITYKVSLPKAGTYNLYAKVLVEAGGAKDDSFFYARSFGEKAPDGAADWITCNGLLGVGYTNNQAESTIDNEGTAKLQVWKWVNLSTANLGEPAATFKVKDNALVQTFQIGARENGLQIDKFAFAPASDKFTVQALNASN